MAKSHHNYYLAITNENIVPVKTYDEADALSSQKPGGLTKGFDSYQDAVDAIPSIRADIERRLSKKKQKRNRSHRPQAKVDMSYLKAFLPEYQPKTIKLALTCHFGGKNTDSTITDSNGVTDIVLFTSGASAQLKYLELAYAALQWAKRDMTQGAGYVDIWGVDVSVLATLRDWAQNARERGWVNSYGKPFANRDVVEPMLALYEKLGDKVTLNAGELLVDDTAPF